MRSWPVHICLRGELHSVLYCTVLYCTVLTCAHWFAGRAPLAVAALEGAAAHQGEAGVAGEGAGPGGRVPRTLHLAIGQARHLALRWNTTQLPSAETVLHKTLVFFSSLEIWQVVCSSVAALGAAVFCCRFVCNYQLFLLWPRTFHINTKLSPQPRVGPSIIHILHTALVVGRMLILHPTFCMTESAAVVKVQSLLQLWSFMLGPNIGSRPVCRSGSGFAVLSLNNFSCLAAAVFTESHNQTISFVWRGRRDSSLQNCFVLFLFYADQLGYLLEKYVH